jgi:hypothetical protein
MESTPSHRLRTWLLLAAAAAGAAVGGAGVASAATGGSSSPTTAASTAAARTDSTDAGTRPTEAPLSGETADKVEAAALGAVPGGTVLRVETDSDGSAFEAHVRTAEGDLVTVKVGANFQVTEVQEGGCPGGGPGGPGRPRGPAGDGDGSESDSGSSSSSSAT